MTWKRSTHHAISRHRNNFAVRQVALAARSFLRAVENDNSDGATNGEWHLMERLPHVRVAVDCGANRGAWTSALLSRHPEAHVHCFEIHPGMAADLSRHFAGDQRVTVHPVGLSELSADVEITYDPALSAVTSLVPMEDRAGWEHVAASVVRLDEAVAGPIDLLKIDAEGHDLEVLRGASGLLETDLVDVVQFEFTMWSALARHWLADFYDELVPRGCQVGKLFPDGVEWRTYSPEYERFDRCNYVAVRAGRADLVDTLRSR